MVSVIGARLSVDPPNLLRRKITTITTDCIKFAHLTVHHRVSKPQQMASHTEYVSNLHHENEVLSLD